MQTAVRKQGSATEFNVSGVSRFIYPLKLLPRRLAISMIGTASLVAAQSLTFAAPLGLPKAASVDSFELVHLGGELFADRRLSVDGSMSCSVCHVPEKYFTDRLTTARGLKGKLLSRNTPSLINVAYETSLFWDGRAIALDEQATLPLLNPSEHGFNDPGMVVDIIRRDARYRNAFQITLGRQRDEISIDDVGTALAAYERSILIADSPFDRYQYAHDSQAMSDSAIRGLALFRGRARCATCHLIDREHAIFTDGKFHMAPRGLSAAVSAKLGALTRRIANLQSRSATQALNTLITTDPEIASLGRFVFTLDPKDIGNFKTPSLRNIAMTSPYMHDGSVPTLTAAIELELYSRSAPNYPLVLTQNERADLLNFLESLTSTR